MYNILCVKWGTKYSHECVNALYNSLKEHDYPFYCYTEDPTGLDPGINIIDIPSKPILKVWWNKLRMFSSEFPVQGKIVYFDLDVKINSNPFSIIETIDWSKLNVIACPWKNDAVYDRPTNYDVRIHSSVMAWESGKHINEIWDYFINSGYRDYFLRKYVGIDRYIVHEEFDYNTFPYELAQSMMYEPDKVAPITTFEEYDDKRNILSKSS